MKIKSAKLENDLLQLTIEGSPSKIYLDSIDNKANVYSDDDSVHTVVKDLSDNIVEDPEMVIDMTKYNLTAVIVRIEDQVVLAVDLVNLYQRKVNMLETFCETCLDGAQKEKIVLCAFKSQLFEYAYENGLMDDAIQFYTDLCRLLEIPTAHVCGTYSKRTTGRCRTCSGNYCGL
jgi:hypothetical protein